MVADWLRFEIASGLQKLLALRLMGTPPEDAIVGTAEVWLEAMAHCGIQWVEHLDRERVRRAFQTLFRICDRWPAPKAFLDNLGNRDPPKALPRPPIPPEEMERNRALLNEMLKKLTNRKRISSIGVNNADRKENTRRLQGGRQRPPSARTHDQTD